MELNKFFCQGAAGSGYLPGRSAAARSSCFGYADEEALCLTMETGTAWFFRARVRKLWNEGRNLGQRYFCVQNTVRL